jgi:hypothetical protein
MIRLEVGYPRHSIRAGSGMLLASYSMRTRGYSLAVEATRA